MWYIGICFSAALSDSLEGSRGFFCGHYNGETKLDVEQTGCFEMCGTSSTASWISFDYA